jgi:hypothetical protein
LNLKPDGVLLAGTPRLRKVVNLSPTTTDLTESGCVMTVELIKAQIDKLANDSYEEGWKDCKENLSLQPFNAERTESLASKCEELTKQNRIQERRLRLAVKLLRHAQASECGQLGQYDRFFQERYEVGFEEEA